MRRSDYRFLLVDLLLPLAVVWLALAAGYGTMRLAREWPSTAQRSLATEGQGALRQQGGRTLAQAQRHQAPPTVVATARRRLNDLAATLDDHCQDRIGEIQQSFERIGSAWDAARRPRSLKRAKESM